MLLVSPSGSNVLVMSHTGGGYAVTNLNLTFDDAAAGTLPNYNPLTSGTYKPSSYRGAGRSARHRPVQDLPVCPLGHDLEQPERRLVALCVR